MATTLSEDDYNDLRAKIDNYEFALRDIASWFDEGMPVHDPFAALDSINEVIGDLKTEGYLA